MKRLILILLIVNQFGLAKCQNNFSFIFLPDLHLQPDSIIDVNFNLLVKQINKLNPDFIITGGDMIYTAKDGDEEKAKKLFDFMDKKLDLFKLPVYYTLGNHEVVGIMPESGIDSSHPLWGKQMYEQRYGKRYKSFEISGCKFFLLDGIKILEKEMNYTQGVDSLQMQWIRGELEKTNKDLPIIVSIHTPLINPKAMTDSNSRALSKNAEDVLGLFEGYNLKVVLQGHNHVYMNLYIHGVHFISGGSTALGSDLDSFDDGFVIVNVKNNKEEIKFIPTYRPVKIYN